MTKNPVKTFIINAGVSPLLSSDWLTLADSLPTTCDLIEVFNPSTTPIMLSKGPVGQENILPLTIMPGGTPGITKLIFEHDKRLAIKPLDNISAGFIVINLYTESP